MCFANNEFHVENSSFIGDENRNHLGSVLKACHSGLEKLINEICLDIGENSFFAIFASTASTALAILGYAHLVATVISSVYDSVQSCDMAMQVA
jgi:hypothetical protein